MPSLTKVEYEIFIYSLVEKYTEVVSSSLQLYSTSSGTAIVRGEIVLNNGVTLRILEILNFRTERIQKYSYAVYQDDVKIRWYDPQPHPENIALVANFPHHYHEQPDIKHNRKTAVGITFFAPNLSILIADCLVMESR